MNFQALKGMVDSLIHTFTCSDCGSKVTEEFVEIIGTAGQSLNIDIECPKCAKHSMVKAQVLPIDLPIEMKFSEEELEKIENKEMEFMKDKLSKIENFDKELIELTKNPKISDNKNNNSIKDDVIISLNKSLKTKNFTMEDLFKEI